MKSPYSLAAAIALWLACVMPLAPVRAATPADQLLVGMNMNNVLTLDPAAATGNDVVPVAANLYDYVVELDPRDVTRVLPAVADRWTIAADRRSIAFKIHPGIRFQSGNPLTADDVAWSLQRTLKVNRALASPWKSYGFTAKNAERLIRAVDPATLVIDLPIAVDPGMVIYTLGTSIGAVVLDRRTVLAHERNGDLGAAWLTTHTAGSGPFALADWKPEDVLTLQRFDGYWRGPAKLRRVVLRHIPESQSLRLMIDRSDVDVALGLSAPDLVALRRDAAVNVQSVAGGSMYYVALSMKDARFADKRVREAIRSLIDYEGINRFVMPGYGVPHQRPVQAGLPASLPDPGYRLDVPKARRLLAEAGYPDGFAVDIRVLADAPFLNIATSLQATLAQAGIRANVLTGTGNQVYGAMRERRFEIVVGRGGGGLEPDPYSNLRALVYNPDNRDAAKLTNFQGWRTAFYDPEINRLFTAAQAASDPTEQTEMYRRVQQRYADVVGPIFPISQTTNTVVLAKRVEGYELSPVWTTHLRSVSKRP
ncbi:ABC transporter substrate-binding protein [Pandoraea terrae]|uniref:ABC transporter substrate-binding protein n=1 Tax=Pandoraea terrae TaxID=1537710 RepID=A0A5E4XK18_9BURK|nr:ABC transporter substrate-binding protein [Pandoraea terrae]VVE36518.1 ABC transporter substrate-binding protein [Pandoraea terrae]